MPKKDRFKKILDAGLNSIKFSVNGGNRNIYKKVHGRDHFDQVISNIRYVNQYRQHVSQDVFLGISFVGMESTRDSYNELCELIGDQVDEVIYYEASNQSGQMPYLPLPPYRDCHLPFNKLHISREGYIKACCNDYENILAIEDLNNISLDEAWHSKRFQSLRKQHIDNKLDKTLCNNCIRASNETPTPINSSLLHNTNIQLLKKTPILTE